MKKEHGKKMIAPIVITLILLAYLAVYLVLLFGASKWSIWQSVLFAVPLVAAGVCLICVLTQRIKEIEKGEEDDLSNY